MDDTTTLGAIYGATCRLPRLGPNIQKCRWRSAGLDRSGQAGGSLPSRGQPRGLGLRVNALIPPGGGGITPLCSAGGAVRCSTSVPGGSLPCGMVFAPVSCAPPLEAARAAQPETEAQKILSDPCRAIDRARATHVSSLLPATLSLPVIAHTEIAHTVIAHTVDRTSVKYPGLGRSVGQRCPLGHIDYHRMDLMPIRWKGHYFCRWNTIER